MSKSFGRVMEPGGPRGKSPVMADSHWVTFARGCCFSACGERYRFFGRLVKPDDGDIPEELTHTGERPTRQMRMLPEPIPQEESRAWRVD